MRRTLTLLIVLGLLVGLVAGCGTPVPEPTQPPEPTSPPEPTAAPTEEEPQPQPEDKFKVGFIYNTPVGSMGWAYSLDLGRQYVEQNVPGVETVFAENIPDGPDAERVMTQMAEEGCDMIFGTSVGIVDYVMAVAEKYPDVKFENYDQYKLAPNVSSYRVRIDQAFYLAGIAAGKMSETGQFGFVAAFPIPQLVRNISAFHLGGQSVNPELTTNVVWINTWYDPAKTKETAESFMAAGVDVLSHHGGDAAVIQAAEANGKYAVGYTQDQGSYGPNSAITSAMFNWGPVFAGRVQAAIDGTWEPVEYWADMADGAVELAPWGQFVPDEVRQLVQEKQDAIISGELEVFAGPIKDQEGNIRVPEGEVMSVGDMLSMDWFVQGVEGNPK